MRHTKKKIRQLTVAMAAVVFSLSAAAVDAYASSVTDTQEQVMIEDEETIEIDPNTTYLSGTTGWVMEGGVLVLLHKWYKADRQYLYARG